MATKSDVAYEYIKQKIISGALAPLTPIDESQIQKELDTSRTPVREAILRLRDSGFIYNYSNQGNLVSEISLDLINEIYTARYVNEPIVNIGASHIVSKDFLLDLRNKFLNPPEEIKEDANKLSDYFITLDDGLHEGLLKLYPNRFIQKVMLTVFDHNRRLRRFSTKISIDEHIEIIDAVLSKDESKIRETTIAHLDGSQKLTLDAYRTGALR